MTKSYKRIAAASTTTQILTFLADQKAPVSGATIANALGMQYGTTMCYLATLADDQFVAQTGDNFELGSKLAFIWARYRARLESQINRLSHELNELEV